jgi:flagellar biosynthesis/type III secretory pathway chaperone
VKSTIRELIHILEQEHQLYARMLERLGHEKSVLLGSRARQLTRLTDEKQVISAQLAKLEEQRQSALNRIAGELNLPVQHLTLSSIARRVDPPYSERLLKVRDALKRATQAVKVANEESRYLVQHCLGLVQGSISFLRQLISPPPVYGSSGGIAANKQNGHLLSRQF